MIRAACLLAALAAPAAAQAPTPMQLLTDGLETESPFLQMMGSAAACHLAVGDPDQLNGLLAIAGWLESEPADGVRAWSSPQGTTVTLLDDGAICDVESPALSIAETTAAVAAAFEAGGVAGYELAEDDGGCTVALDESRAAGALVGVISSGGQDPTCTSDAGSAIRFEAFN